jgi:phenylacetic acid degradation operon negative regulatory protein
MARKGPRTQDLIFTLYGDYLVYRGGVAWIGSLIELLGTLGVSEQAVRSAASRMARKNWLASEKAGRLSFYSLTPRAFDLLDKGARQIFQPRNEEWDGCWHLITYAFSDDLKSERHHLRDHLSWLGFGQLTAGTMIAPRDYQDEVCALLADLEVHEHVDYFEARPFAFTDNRDLARRCWDLDELNERYWRFITKYQPQFEADCQAEESGSARSLAHHFRQRFWLIHEYRYFPFADPYLPHRLLPGDWHGRPAAKLFQDYHAFLQEKANRYVDDILSRAPAQI